MAEKRAGPDVHKGEKGAKKTDEESSYAIKRGGGG